MAGKDGSAGGIWHWHGKLSHGMRMLEAAKNSGSGGALSLEGKKPTPCFVPCLIISPVCLVRS